MFVFVCVRFSIWHPYPIQYSTLIYSTKEI
jgi:hypothetical protein